MQINWDAAGAIGEIIGAVAVLATLIYLARQMRQNNDLQRMQVSSVFLQNRVIFFQALYQNDDLMQTILRAREDEDLNPLERMRLSTYYRSVLVLFDWEYQQYDYGLLDESATSRIRDVVGKFPRFQDSWSEHKVALSPKFVHFMETDILN